MTNDEIVEDPLKKSDFICGVVEGFYGRPWTTEQRKDLFQKLKKWGMDCYLYAPKDDYKHRAYWRELYTVEEAEHLSGLIASAKESGITFYYALSPGLDITYSSSKEVSTLKRKLEQVAQFGCNAFALLFDDIEPEMTEADKEVFQSFAHAQVCITNEVFQQLNQPQFIVCPTQYCSARANPDVKNSEYLNTLGSKLAPEIDIMWTGQKVISRLLTVECIEEITEVLKRPPVIWDNIHANDYDQKRIFLGPYQGRSPDVIKKLRGVLTNPNCEYGANFIAIHTLAQWSKCSTDAIMHLNLNDSVSADIKLETESEDGVTEDMPCSLPDNIYHPRRALKNAICDWLLEFKRPKAAWGPISKPQPSVPMPVPVPIILPSINTCMTLTTTTTSITSVISTPSTVSSNQLQEITCSNISCTNSSMLQPTSNGVPVVMNSLASENKVISEPMEVNMTPTDSPIHLKSTNSGDVPMIENSNIVSSTLNRDDAIPSPESTMIVDIAHNDSSDSISTYSNEENELRYEDLALLCDLFYLPFEHGSQGVQIMQEFNWLKSNAHIVSLSNLRRHNTRTSPAGENTPEVQEWRERARKLMEVGESVNQLFLRLTHCNNRELLHELYPYVWDMRGVVSLLNSYIKWLGFSKGWKENFMSGDQEPWVFRGGLTADLQRLIPVDAGADLFTYKPPEIPINKIYTIRPYTTEDEAAVYDICRRTCLDGEDGTEVFRDYPDLAAERVVGGFLTISPEFCFVVEDQTGIVGYAAAALNAKHFYSKIEICWVPEMREKYPEDSLVCDSSTTEEIKNWFHSFRGELLPDNVQFQHPSVMCASLSPTVIDQSTAKGLIVCLLAALRANGSFGVYVPVNARDKNFIDFYCKLGFVELCQGLSSTFVYLGRIF